MTADVASSETATRQRSRLRQILAMLAAEFLLGMGANLIGMPSEVTGSARTTTLTLLGLHVALAIGIVVVAVLVNAATLRHARSRTMAGLITVVVTVLAGAGTMATDSGWLSFVMAAGFLVSAGVYVGAYVEAARTPAP